MSDLLFFVDMAGKLLTFTFYYTNNCQAWFCQARTLLCTRAVQHVPGHAGVGVATRLCLWMHPSTDNVSAVQHWCL